MPESPPAAVEPVGQTVAVQTELTPSHTHPAGPPGSQGRQEMEWRWGTETAEGQREGERSCLVLPSPVYSEKKDNIYRKTQCPLCSKYHTLNIILHS